MEFTKRYIDSLHEYLYFGTHHTGLRVYVIPKEGFSKTYAIYGTKFGSINNCFVPLGEKNEITVPDGVAHFLEHKMFEMPDGSNAFDLFSKYGANANAFTSFTNTSYLFSCTSHFKECFAHLLDYVQKPYFTKENIEKEQGIIAQEIRMYDDEGEWQVTFNMLRAMYHANPVRIDIAGTVESISKIDKEVLYNCYNTYYNPANMVVCVVGNVKAETVFDIVEKTIESRENGKVKSVYPEEPCTVNQKYIEAKSSISRPIFAIGFKDNYPKCGSELLKRELQLNLIATIIAGRSSKFYNENYDSGLINDTFAKDIMCEDAFSCVSFAGESDNPKLVLSKLTDTIEKYRKDGFNEDEFSRIKKAYFGSFIRKFNNVEGIGNLLCKGFLSDIDPTEFPEVFKSITCESLQQVLNEVFISDNCVLSVVNPVD